jgi:sucrose phosphorylase
MMSRPIDSSPMLNAYPDSIGANLGDIVGFLQKPELQDVFGSFYILPSIFNTDLDRGFSVIDYSINELLGSQDDLDALRALGIDLKLDFVLNHASVLSKQFQDILSKGYDSKYKDFFINWNSFWNGKGRMTEEGYIQPEPELIRDMFFRKPGLPILMVRFPDGSNVPYWNTFYQEVRYKRVDALDLMGAMEIQYGAASVLTDIINTALDSGKKPADIPFGRFERYRDAVIMMLESGRRYLGQMDLNIASPLVWEFYDETLRTLSAYGARIVRLDAFAYAPKTPGKKNFLNEPETWDLLERVRALADKYGLTLLPEIHASYNEKTYEKIAARGYMTYDFFLPGLIIDALERHTGDLLIAWAKELRDRGIRTVNMLGCHDGIPLLDLKGLLNEDQIQSLIDIVVARGGYVKDLHGQKNVYYQVNSTYYSALGEDDRKMLLARAIQIFMPGKPQVWYLDLFDGRNDHEAVHRAGAGGHKEINRTNLTLKQAEEALNKQIVKNQLELLRFRATFPTFGFDGRLQIAESTPGCLRLTWEKEGFLAALDANLSSYSFTVMGTDPARNIVYAYRQL